MLPTINIELKGIDIVAWWGAILATLVLIWDIYKWKTSGPKIRFVVRAGMIIVGDPTRTGQFFISAEATNLGERPTTITNLVIQHYKSYFSMLRHKPQTSMLVTEPSVSQRLPYVLQPGTVWQGLCPQTDEIENLAKTGYLVCGLCHSHSDKEIDRRVIIKKEPKA
ncbi:MAG: hypothetical protein FP813_04635 [Desulfurivibrio sp.]|nr:hypothetical protein [Desulfurivibrio sp.]